MSRLRTVGFEIGTGSGASIEGSSSFGASLDFTFSRSGSGSLICDSGAANQAQRVAIILSAADVPANGTTTFSRAYFHFTNLPTATGSTVLMAQENLTSVAVSARLTSAGKLQLWNDVLVAQIGSDSVDTLTTGIWYRVELSFTTSSSVGTQAAALLLDGVSVATGSNLTIVSGGTYSVCRVGWRTAPGINSVCHVDDFALNSSSGSIQNSWPGNGKIVLLNPISDSSRTGWVAGAGGTTNLWQAVTSIPPAGSGTETNTSQIKDTVSSATDNYDANLRTYTSAGILASDTITLVQGVLDYGFVSPNTSRNGSILIVSNPAQAVEDTFDFVAALGAVTTWPTGWHSEWGTAQYSPSVILGNSPVLRVGKRTATGNEVDVDFMGIMVEYVSSASTTSHRLALLGVGH